LNTSVTPFIDEESGEQAVRGFLHSPSAPLGDALLLTHGAGANCQSPLLVALAEAFCAAGMTVLRFDLPFRQKRPKGPPLRSSKEDQAGIQSAVSAMRRIVQGRIFLGGHSYGGRQSSMLAASKRDLCEGLLLLSYPLHPPQKPEQLRTAHFPSLQTASLFVHGSSDGFATKGELEEARTLIPARTELLEIAGAGHELLSKKNRMELLEKILVTFAGMFLRH
jgi:predicted alpha/beta-hydrolase family hydrolase